ncbi:MAG: WD40 repeat domain-containing protein [Gemmataceae bacterium]|nr:WD40 repeat domain-containing protein [Gemmataceae bacterium]
MQILTGLGKDPRSLAFSPDGRLLGGGDTEAFRLWDPSAGPAPLWVRAQFNDYLRWNFAFTPDGASVVGGQGDSFARYDIRTGAKTPDLFLRELQPIGFAPNGWVALGVAADNAGLLRLRCARTATDGKWDEVWRKGIPFDPASGASGYRFLRFSADGGRLVRVFTRKRGDRTPAVTGVEVYDSDTGSLLAEWSGKLPFAASECAVAPSGVLALTRDASLFVCDPTAPRSKFAKHRNGSAKHFTSVAFSPDGSKLATTSNDTAATLWDTTTWQVTRRYEWAIGRLRVVCFSPDGLRCAAGIETGQIVVWDLD